MHKESVSIIIPAFNEGPRIGTVSKSLNSISKNWEVIVVCDGCSDDTASVARKFDGVKVVDLERNVGKAAAMFEGFKVSKGDIIIFLDADLLGLKQKHLDILLDPIIKDGADFSISTFRSMKNIRVTLAHVFFPHLSGQRCAKKEKWQEVFDGAGDLKKLRFGIEEKIKEIGQGKKWRFQFVKWQGVSQVTKEGKLGFIGGVKYRMKMYKEIIIRK